MYVRCSFFTKSVIQHYRNAPVGTPGYDYAVDKLFMEEPQDRKTSWKSRWEYSIKPTRFFLDRNPEVPGTGIAIPDDNKH